MRAAITLALLLLPAANQACGQVIFLGSPYSQNFDTLASTGSSNPWVNNTTLPGWYSTEATYKADDGTGNTARLYSYGGGATNPLSERALGSISSNSLPTILYGVQILNATGGTIESFDLSYFGEQWRNSGGGTANRLAFSYLVKASATNELNGSGYAAVPSLDFVSIAVSPPATALDGNDPQNRTLLSGTIANLGWDPGEYLWLRWTDMRNAGTPNNGLALDDFVFTAAVPELGAVGLVALLASGGCAVRNLRRRSPAAPSPAEGGSSNAGPSAIG